MNSRILTISIGACLLAASTYANAATPEKDGWYLGTGIGYSGSEVMKPYGTFTGGKEKNSDTGMKLYGGYQFNNMWAVEFEYVDFGKYTYKQSVNEYSIKSSGMGVSGIANLPLSNEFSLFGKIGIFKKTSKERMQGEVEENGKTTYGESSLTIKSIEPMIGLGAEYHFTQNVSLRAEYEHFGKNKMRGSNIILTNHLLSFSVRYTF